MKVQPLSLPLLRRHATVVVALAAVSLASASDSLVPIGQSAPTAIQGAKLLGRVPAATVLNLAVGITPANRDALKAYSNAVSNPMSPLYHRFLTPAQIGQRFGASSATVNATTSYLKSKGLTVTLVADNRMAVLVKGRADKIEAAFSTKLNRYSAVRPAGLPQTFFANATAAKAPSSIASKIVCIEGLDNANPPSPRSTLKPQDTRKVYDVNGLYDGTSGNGHKGEGINIGVSSFDGYRLSNLGPFYSTYGLPAPAGGVGSNVTKVVVGGIDGETLDPGVEGDLDIQAVLAMAPKCNLFIYDGAGGGRLATVTREAQDNTADIITESYGWAGDTAFWDACHDQQLAMTAQGITYMCASGDSGTSDLNTSIGGGFFAYPDFDPDVLMVGGTDVTIDGNGNRLSEVGWDGSGSGWFPTAASFNVRPPYQTGNGVPAGPDFRLVPDIALHAAPTGGYFIFVNQQSFEVGGTSAATPTFAGQLGLILQTLNEQNAVDLAGNGRPRLGRLQDYLYDTGYSEGAIIDILGGDAGQLPDGTESVGKAGWDFVTGLGAPDVQAMYDSLLSRSSIPVSDGAVSASIYGNSGSSISGNATDPNTGLVDNLIATDGGTVKITTARQAGLGQVGAAQIDIRLSNPNRRSASLQVTMTSPELTTGYVYLYNWATGKFDQTTGNFLTITGNGTARTVNKAIDLAADYIDPTTQTVRLLVRAIKPARLGNLPFTLSVDQATVIERVPRS